MAIKQTMSPAIVSSILAGTANPHLNVNSNPTPSVADKSVALYDKHGKLLGYIPVFSTDWVNTEPA